MPVDDAPDDNVARETYNFPPGAYGLVYRADIPDNGLRGQEPQDGEDEDGQEQEQPDTQQETEASQNKFNFQLKAMKWGLIPFWTKRSPDYGSMLRTINCRDDSLIENRGMWTSMKQRKRCIVIAQGFFEWLKRGPNGKEKIPHFVKRKDGNLMCFAGLWDCVKYEDAEEKLYSYTIITTDANKQLTFLHDRMPVILDPNSDAMRTWLDPTRTKWSKDLQSLLVPYQGELECYPVDPRVGKVGNNSPNFIVPVDSKENKKNIANFFGNAKKQTDENTKETRNTADQNSSENKAPMPVPASEEDKTDLKRKSRAEDVEKPAKIAKQEMSPQKPVTPVKSPVGSKAKSATSNEGMSKKISPMKSDGSQRITSFFGKGAAG